MELALLTPVLLLLSVGALELGRGVWVKHMLTYTARETVRYASVRSVLSDEPATISSIAARARSEMVGIDPAKVGVQVTWKPANQAGGSVHVRLDYSFRPIGTFLPFDALQLKSEAEQMISY